MSTGFFLKSCAHKSGSIACEMCSISLLAQKGHQPMLSQCVLKTLLFGIIAHMERIRCSMCSMCSKLSKKLTARCRDPPERKENMEDTLLCVSTTCWRPDADKSAAFSDHQGIKSSTFHKCQIKKPKTFKVLPVDDEIASVFTLRRVPFNFSRFGGLEPLYAARFSMISDLGTGHRGGRMRGGGGTGNEYFLSLNVYVHRYVLAQIYSMYVPVYTLHVQLHVSMMYNCKYASMHLCVDSHMWRRIYTCACICICINTVCMYTRIYVCM